MLIVQLSDLHVRPRGLPGNRVIETNALTERALRAVARLTPRPDVVIVTGDLVDVGSPAEYAVLKALLDRYLPGGAHVIPGNHDTRAALIDALAPPVAPTGFIDYAVELGAIRLVMLDTLVEGHGWGELRPEQIAWLDETLAGAPQTPTMVALHHPPFATGIEHMDAIALREPQALASVLGRHAQVERIVCGHCHRNIVAQLGPATVTVAPSVGVSVALDLSPGGPSAFVKEPPQFAIHRWTSETGFVTHAAYIEDFEGPYPFLTYGPD